MTRPNHSARVLAVVVSLLLAVAAAGCLNAPTAPTQDGSASVQSTPPVLRIAADGSASWVPVPTTLDGGSYQRSTGLGTYDPSRRLSRSVTIDGAVGGRVVCGRYVLSVPAGAFVGVGTVTMTLPDSTLMLCDLDIAPAELNGFLAPLDLDLHTTNTTTAADSVDFYWWDPDKSSWTSMGGEPSTTLDRVLQEELLTAEPTSGVRLQLNHFSRYMAGKAGW